MQDYRFNRRTSLAIDCPKCGASFSKTFGELQTHDEFRCAECRHLFDARQFNAGLKNAEAELNKFRRNIHQMFRKQGP